MKLRAACARIGALVGLEPSTLRHCQRVRTLSVFIGENLGLSSSELATLSLGSLLHDVGKKQVPRDVLLKSTPLTENEWKTIQQHPVHGYGYAKERALDDSVQEIILHHHRWFDGTGGYPEDIDEARPSCLTQITSVADVMDAMTRNRPYRRALSLNASLDFLAEQSGTQFSPVVVDSVHRNLHQIKRFVGA